MSTNNSIEFNNKLGQISSNTPILFFPLRIETHFRSKANNSNELCVRIFPDEIFLDYLTDKLTEEEINDAKCFWIQWYIAGGNKKREYEAWQALCFKYPVYRAAWLVRKLKPLNINDFRKTGAQFMERPFTEIPEIRENIACIYSALSNRNFFTDDIMRLEQSMRDIFRYVESYMDIVDYLYDDIEQAIECIERYIGDIMSLVEKKPYLWRQNRWSETVPLLNDSVGILMSHIKGKRISLDDLIQKYLKQKHPIQSLHKLVFPTVKKNVSGQPDVPVSNILPDRFMFIGEVPGRTEKIIQYGNRVRQNLQMGINPNEDPDENPYVINSDGDLVVDGGIDWMIDYDKAVNAGMAITVPIDGAVNEFTYVYVLGIKDVSSQDEKYLQNLFNSHNYSSSGIAMLKTATPTNIVDGMEPAYNPDPEVEMEIRYEIEVEEAYNHPDKEQFDSWALAKSLHLDYDNCCGKTGNFDNTELNNAQTAYKIMWDYFFNKLTRNETAGQPSHTFLKQMGNFMEKYVRARGAYPSFRIENKPYSILPISDLKKLYGRYTSECPSYLIKVLIELADKWKEVRKREVLHSEILAAGNSNSDTASKKFLNMAGQTPYSTTFYERSLINSPLLPIDKWYPDAMKSNFDLLHKYGFFDPWPIGGSERKIAFNDSNGQLLGVLNLLKEKMPSLSDKERELLVSEFIDVFTHRLDAWITGVFEHIRAEKCNKRPKIGAYGWAFDLKKTPRSEVNTTTKNALKAMNLIPEDAPADLKIYQNNTKGGYIVAPSVQHAITAAVLRAAYMKTQKNKEDSHLCINLSSMRTRQALRMVDGIKQGMSTGIILGADLERYLHEAYKMNSLCEMDQYIYPMRMLFPQVVSLQAEDKRAHDHVMQVINGEALLNTFIEEWSNDGSVSSWLEKKYNDNKNKTNKDECIEWFFDLNGETGIAAKNNGAHRTCLFKLIERLVDSYDALNDLLLAEGVHRLVMGDLASYSAINNFMAEGKGNLPEPAILDTPMEYVVVSNKVGIAFPECKTPPGKPMCMAEPSVHLWLEQLTGKLDNILFYIETTNAQGGIGFETCTLYDLDIKPIEYLYLSSNETLFLKYLEARWRVKYNRLTEKIKLHAGKPEGCTEDTICFNEKGETITNLFTLYEDELRISRLRSIVVQSGEMKANDWVASAYGDYDKEMTVDIQDLKSRYGSLRSYLDNLSDDMSSLINSLNDSETYDDATLAGMYGDLCRCVTAGMLNSLPEFDSEMFVYKLINTQTDDKEYHINPITQAQAVDDAVEKQQAFIKTYRNVCQELADRISEAEEMVKLTGDETYTSEQYVEVIKKLLMNNFKVCPRFTLHYASELDMRKAYDSVLDSGINCYDNVNGLSFEEWQFDVAEVREPMKKWHHVSMFQDVSDGNTGRVSILQTDGEGTPVQGKWLGCKVAQEADLQDVDSLVVYNSEALTQWGTANNKPAFNAGLIIDAWNEFIPYKKQTAGMVFHCDQPDNEAPQALLLALNTKYLIAGEKWTMDDVLELLDFTRFMLMNRAVEPDHIYKDEQLSRLFPLLSNKELSINVIN